jgi:photosystem II stability/assembly factor-like uncharacterized protein
MEVEMHRVLKQVGYVNAAIVMLIALSGVAPAVAMDLEPRALDGTLLVEVDAARLEEAPGGLHQLLAHSGVSLAARADEAVFFYSDRGGLEVLESLGVGARLLMEEVGDSEIYLVPITDGIDVEALGERHRILSRTGTHLLIAAEPGTAMEIHLLPFKQRLPDVWQGGLPADGSLSRRVEVGLGPLAYSPVIQDMVNSVSQGRLYSTLSGLSGESQVLIGGDPYTINTRYSPTPMCKKAGQFILETFQAMGLEAEYDYFNWRTLMKAVQFPADDQTGWAVGQQMTVLHTEDGGEVWVEQYYGDEGALNDVFMLDNLRGCIVGNGGIVMVTDDGGTWQRVYPPTSNDLNNLYFVDDSTAYCCGEGGVILKSVDRGFSWASLTSGTGQDLHGISFADPMTGWVVGMNGVIRKTQNGGASWTYVSSPTGVDLYDVTCQDEQTCWACGRSGTIVKTDDGVTWEDASTPVTEDLKSVCFVNDLRGYACGKLGTMIRSLDGGATWNDLGFPANQNLNDVYFISPSEGWVVGLAAVHHTTTGGTEWEDQRNGVQAGDVNVVATIPGTTNPEEIYIICGHYDSISQMPEISAPGADDNGTGTVGVIEAATVLKDYSFESTLRFVCFSREEQGLVGSGAYAREAHERGDSIVGALNFDMIGYVDEVPEDLDLLYNGISEWLADAYVGAAALYVPDLDIIKKYATYVGSDNSSFWDYGYPAFCGIEDSQIQNPYYHRTTDRISTLNFDFYTDVVRGAVATLAELARIDTVTSSVVGVFDGAEFRASPNPGRGNITIEMSPSGGTPEAFRIYSVEGKLVKTLEPAVTEGLVRAAWNGTDASGSPVGPGIYFVKISGRAEGTKVVLLR